MKTNMVLFIAILATNSCSVAKNMRKSSLKTDSTASKLQQVNTIARVQQESKIGLLDSAFNNLQTDYQRRTITFHFAKHSGGTAVYDNAESLENRLTSITVSTENSKQASQSGNVVHHNSNLKSDIQASQSQKIEDKISVEKKQVIKERNVKRTGGFSFGWLWLIVPVGIIFWKRRQIAEKAVKLLNIARSQLGLKEIPKGSNWGRHVEKFLKAVGITFATAWCMAFVFWVVQQYSEKNNVTNPLYKTGGVKKEWDMRPDLRVTDPQPGDLFVILNKDSITGHIGFVEKVAAPYIYTIEGNSNTNGSSEGFEVVRNKRKIKSVTGFLRVLKE